MLDMLALRLPVVGCLGVFAQEDVFGLKVFVATGEAEQRGE